MRRRIYNFMPFLLALLVAVSAWTPGYAEVQMRCVGMPAQASPCASMNLPAAWLPERQVSGMLRMACCRSMPQDAQRGCPMHHAALGSLAPRSVSASAAAAHHCLVTVRVAARAVAPGVSRARWFLTANPALAPPAPMQSAFAPALLLRPAFWTFCPPLSPHADPHLHGLRAPPAA